MFKEILPLVHGNDSDDSETIWVDCLPTMVRLYVVEDKGQKP